MNHISQCSRKKENIPHPILKHQRQNTQYTYIYIYIYIYIICINVNKEVYRLHVYTTLHYTHFQVLFGLSAVVHVLFVEAIKLNCFRQSNPFKLATGCLWNIPKPTVTLHQQCKLRPGRPMMRHKRTKSRLHFGLNWLRPLSFHPQLFNASPEQSGPSRSAGRPLMKGFQMERLFRPRNAPINPPSSLE